VAIKTVKSLKKGLEILEAFSSHGSSLNLQEITQITGLPKPTAYRFLQTLISLNYIHYFSTSRTYRLGPKVMSLGFSVLTAMDFGAAAQPYLEELSQRIDQNVNLGILDGNDVVYIIRIKRRKILGIDLSVGSRLNAYGTAIGHAILAFSGKEKVESIIQELSQDPDISRKIGSRGEGFKRALAQVRKDGYSLNDGEYIAGLRSVGIPIFKGQHEVEGAINIPVFSQLCSKEKLINEYLPLARDAARIISRLRGQDSTDQKSFP
jgi:IclR family pca regulon transcriptional regulator